MARPQLPWRFTARIGALVALFAAIVAAVAVLVAQLVALDSAVAGRGSVRLSFVGPTVKPSENPLYAIREVLSRQSEALLRGDRDGYLYAIPTERRELLEQARQRFDSLTALHVRRWNLTTSGTPSKVNGEWDQWVDIGYCFYDSDCKPIEFQVETSWTVVHGRLQLVGYRQSTRPWDNGRLAVKESARVTVAGPADDTAVGPVFLERVLRAANTAASNNDRFAIAFNGAPKHFFVYVAGPSQWQRWYDGGGEYAAAYTKALQPGASDVVVNVSDVKGEQWNTVLLTHEFGHVVTLGGTSGSPATWWLIEGIAEYIANGDGAALAGDLPSVKAYLAAGQWDGTVALGPATKDATLKETVARYGIALLAVTYLAEHYGEAKMLAFFTAAVRQLATLQAASQSVFGTDWQVVSKDAAAYIRAAAK